jgi:hypothetical protein
LDSQLIDQSYGEWMEIWNELTLEAGKRAAFDRMTGNIDEFTAPRQLDPQVVIINNRISYSTYPAATPVKPSIPGRQFYVPLPFWFCRNPALALPLVSLQYNVIEVSLELRSLYDLYQVYDISTDEYVSPNTYMGRHGSAAPVTFDNFSAYGGGGPNNVDLSAYLECNYIYLDTAERQTLATMQLDYLVDRVFVVETGGLKENKTVDLMLTNPVKELVWVLRRSDVRDYNEWTNYTRTIPDAGAPILASAKILFNGLERLQEKPAGYFNMLQPYQYHTNTPREGIYMYSFSIFPEKPIASGAFNASLINNIQLYLTMNYDATADPEYDIMIFSRYHNIFRVINGEGRMVFV